MKLLLVTLRKRAGSDDVSRRETLLEGERIHVGRAVSMEIVLSDIDVDYHHATVTLENGRLMMRAENTGGLKVGRRKRDEADLSADSATIARYTFSSEPARDGADAVLVMEEAPAEAVVTTQVERRRGRALEDVLPSRRFLGWLFSIVILGVLVVWPLLDVMQRPGMQSDAAEAEITVVDGMARKDLPFTTPMEAAWSSGPLSTAHSMLEDDCAACHQRPFEVTSNNACLSCHAVVPNHADIADHPAVSLDQTRCASCHLEHNGRDKPTDTSTAGCVSCHAEIKTVSASADIDPINSFGSDHPAFRMAVITGVDHSAETGVTARVERIPFDAQNPPAESTGLKFPHNKHLVAGGLRSPEGRRELGCADCHQLEPGGKLMRPTDMERDCSGCHQMSFDAAGTVRPLPHANEDEVARILTDYFIAAAMEGGVTTQTAPEPIKRKRRRRIAGENTAETQTEQLGLTDDVRQVAIDWAKDETLLQMDKIFGVQLCANCHEAQKFPDQTGTERWRVLPAILQRQWMPKSRFEHISHESMDCSGCHEATTSAKSSDVLMPGIETCRDCHNDKPAAANAGCVACHDYHIEGRAPMSPEHARLFETRAETRQKAKATN